MWKSWHTAHSSWSQVLYFWGSVYVWVCFAFLGHWMLFGAPLIQLKVEAGGFKEQVATFGNGTEQPDHWTSGWVAESDKLTERFSSGSCAALEFFHLNRWYYYQPLKILDVPLSSIIFSEQMELHLWFPHCCCGSQLSCWVTPQVAHAMICSPVQPCLKNQNQSVTAMVSNT